MAYGDIRQDDQGVYTNKPDSAISSMGGGDTPMVQQGGFLAGLKGVGSAIPQNIFQNDSVRRAMRFTNPFFDQANKVANAFGVQVGPYGRGKIEYDQMGKMLQGSSDRLRADIARAGQPAPGQASTHPNPNIRNLINDPAVQGYPKFPYTDFGAYKASPQSIGNQAAQDVLSRYTGTPGSFFGRMQNQAANMMEAGDFPVTDMYQGVQNQFLQLMKDNPQLFQTQPLIKSSGPGFLSGKSRYSITEGGGKAPIEYLNQNIANMLSAQGVNRATLAGLFTGGAVPLQQAEAQGKSALESARYSAIPKPQDYSKEVISGMFDLGSKAELPGSEFTTRLEGISNALKGMGINFGQGMPNFPAPQSAVQAGQGAPQGPDANGYIDLGMVDPQTGKPMKMSNDMYRQLIGVQNPVDSNYQPTGGYRFYQYPTP